MSDPKRWLDDKGEATGLERELLSAGLDVDPPKEAQAAIWAAIATKIVPPVAGGILGGGAAGGAGAAGAAGGSASAGGAATGATAAAGATAGAGAAASVPVAAASAAGATSAGAAVAAGTTAASVGGVKLAIVAVALGGASVATYSAVAPPRSIPTPPAITAMATEPSATPSAVPTTAARSGEATASPEPAPSAEPSAAPEEPPAVATAATARPRASVSKLDGDARAAAASAASEERASRIKEEMALISDARDAYRSGNARAALRLLDEAAKRFPDGAMGQEREKLTIEALAASGDRASARRRAEAFIKAYPKSAFASSVQPYLE